MGVDAKWGRFPFCPEVSRFVPVRPLLSPFRAPRRTKEDKRGQTGKYGCRGVRVYPTECGEQLGRDPSKNGSSKSLVLKSLSGEGTLWDSSLPVALTLWDTPVLCTPPLPLP